MLPSTVKDNLRKVRDFPLYHSLAVIIWGILCLLRPFKTVNILMIHGTRIGEFAARTDLYLRRHRFEAGSTRKAVPIGLVAEPCNRQLLAMFRREFRIIENRHLRRVCSSSPLRNSRFIAPLPCNWNESDEFNNLEPSLSFTQSEEARGEKLLAEIGVPVGAWFVCFHARDPAYLQELSRERDWSYNDFRDCQISNYIEAMKYVSSCGGYAIRVGNVVSEKLPNVNAPRIIDYAMEHRTDFGDIYLSAKCKFYVGCSSGLWIVPLMFNVPVVLANTSPFKFTPFGQRDLFLPKPLWSVQQKRFLTFYEILNSEVCNFERSEQYEKFGVQVLENSAGEILAVTREMNERLDECFRSTDAEEAAQRKFRSLLQPHHTNYGTPARMGAEYLVTHTHFLD